MSPAPRARARQGYYEVRAADADGERVLDAGEAIEPRSLAIAGSRTYRINGGWPRSDLLSD